MKDYFERFEKWDESLSSREFLALLFREFGGQQKFISDFSAELRDAKPGTTAKTKGMLFILGLAERVAKEDQARKERVSQMPTEEIEAYLIDFLFRNRAELQRLAKAGMKQRGECPCCGQKCLVGHE